MRLGVYRCKLGDKSVPRLGLEDPLCKLLLIQDEEVVEGDVVVRPENLQVARGCDHIVPAFFDPECWDSEHHWSHELYRSEQNVGHVSFIDQRIAHLLDSRFECLLVWTFDFE